MAAEPNRLYEITEVPNDASGAAVTRSIGTGEGPLFEDLREVLAHTHVDRPFDASAAQPLLPRDLSRLGPGITWMDSDGDGDADLVVGAGAGGAVAYFENRDGTLVRAGTGAAYDYDVTTLLPEPDGRSLLAGISNYEAPSPNAPVEVPAAVSSWPWPSRAGTPVPPPPPAGPPPGPPVRRRSRAARSLEVPWGKRCPGLAPYEMSSPPVTAGSTMFKLASSIPSPIVSLGALNVLPEAMSIRANPSTSSRPPEAGMVMS